MSEPYPHRWTDQPQEGPSATWEIEGESLRYQWEGCESWNELNANHRTERALCAEILKLRDDRDCWRAQAEEGGEIMECVEQALEIALGVKRTPCGDPSSCDGHFEGGAMKLAEAHVAEVVAMREEIVSLRSLLDASLGVLQGPV